MRSFVNDSEHWCSRAGEARTLADAMSDDVSKRMMLKIAGDYETLAKRAEERSKCTPQ